MYMCLDCHQGLSDSIVTGQLQDATKDPHFEKWNETSLSHIFIASIGYNGKEAQELANKLLEGYIGWATVNSPTAEYAQAVLDCSLKAQAKFAKEALCHEQLRERVNHRDSSIYEGYPKEVEFKREELSGPRSSLSWSGVTNDVNHALKTVWDFGNETLHGLYSWVTGTHRFGAARARTRAY